MREFGYVLGNLDATIILQRPKLSPHKEKIRANLCQLLGADPSVVNIKVHSSSSTKHPLVVQALVLTGVCRLLQCNGVGIWHSAGQPMYR